MCIKSCIIFSYLSACTRLKNGDNNPQVHFHMPVIMPFYTPDGAYTANRSSRG